jgi:hypothetical protein
MLEDFEAAITELREQRPNTLPSDRGGVVSGAWYI